MTGGGEPEAAAAGVLGRMPGEVRIKQEQQGCWGLDGVCVMSLKQGAGGQDRENQALNTEVKSGMCLLLIMPLSLQVLPRLLKDWGISTHL